MPVVSVKVSEEEKRLLVRDAFDASMASGLVVSLSEVVRRRLFPVVEGHPVTQVVKAEAKVDPKEVAELQKTPEVQRVAAELAEKVGQKIAKERPERVAHQHRATSNGPVARCECGAVRQADGVWR